MDKKKFLMIGLCIGAIAGLVAAIVGFKKKCDAAAEEEFADDFDDE